MVQSNTEGGMASDYQKVMSSAKISEELPLLDSRGSTK